MNKIAVVGDVCLDKYIYGLCERLCPEGPVPVLNSKYETVTLGMAGNVYNNLINLLDPTVIQVDLYGDKTSKIEKIRFVDEKTNQLLLRMDVNDQCDRIFKDDLELIENQKYDAIIVSDYCKGFMTDEDIIKLGMLSPLSFLDSKRKLTKEIIISFNLIKLNEYEYRLNKDFVDLYPNRFVITLGSQGVKFLDNLYPPPKIIQTFDVSGAGDTFLAALVSQLLIKTSIYDAIKFAQECCNKVIQKRGTCIYEKNMD